MNHWLERRALAMFEKAKVEAEEKRLRELYTFYDKLEGWQTKYNLSPKDHKHWQYQKGLLSENQELYEQHRRSEICNFSNSVESLYCEVMKQAVPIVYDQNSTFAKLVSVQSIGGPAGAIRYLQFKCMSSPEGTEVSLHLTKEDICCKTRKLTTEFPIITCGPNQEESLGLEPYDSDKGWYFTKKFSEFAGETPKTTALMADYVAQQMIREITHEIVKDLRNNAGTIGYFTGLNQEDISIKDRYEMLYVKIVEMSSVIHRKTLRGGANWLVTHPNVVDIFGTATSGWSPYQPPTKDGRFHYFGTINNRWKLFYSDALPENEILLGYMGDSAFDSGYIYTPYIPATARNDLQPSFNWELSTLTRYGKKMMRFGMKYYGKLVLGEKPVEKPKE